MNTEIPNNSDRKQLEELLKRVDALYRAGRFAEFDKELENYDVENAAPVLIVGMLTISSWAREHLPARAAFVERAELALIGKVGVRRATKLVNNRR